MINSTNKYYAISVYNGGNLTIYGGNFKGYTTAVQVVTGNSYLKGGYYEVKIEPGDGGKP